MEDPKHRAIVEKAIGKITGKRVKVKLVSGEKKVEKETKPARDKDDPAVKKVVDVFGAEVKKVERLHKGG